MTTQTGRYAFVRPEIEQQYGANAPYWLEVLARRLAGSGDPHVFVVVRSESRSGLSRIVQLFRVTPDGWVERLPVIPREIAGARYDLDRDGYVTRVHPTEFVAAICDRVFGDGFMIKAVIL